MFLRIVILSTLVLIQFVAAQPRPAKPGETMEFELAAAGKDNPILTIGLSSGDYVHGTVEAKAKTSLFVYRADGTVYRTYNITEQGPFAFAAEAPGVYRMELAPAAATPPAPGPFTVKLTVKEVLGVDERLASAAAVVTAERV